MADPGSATDPRRARPYRGLDPEARQADRRRRLLEATLELSTAQGFARTTIQDICRLSGVTARHFYEAFASREELMETLYTQLLAENTAAVVAAVAEVPLDLSSMIDVGLAAYIHAMLDDPRRARIMLFEVFSLPEGLLMGEASINSFVALMEAYGAELAAAGALEGIDVHDAAVAISGATKELLIHWVRSEPRRSIDDLVAVAGTTFRRLVGLGPDSLR